MCDRAESQVLEKLAEVQSRVINPTKALLRDRDSGIRALVKAETDHDLKVQQGKATSAPPIPLVEMRHCLRNTEKVVDNNMELFEAQRVEDIKHISGVDGETASEHIREELENLNAKLQYL
eukprot:15841-Heterococcus_DN1.PRE.1